MDCEEFRQELYQYMDGEMQVWRQVHIREHMVECPDCQHGHEFEICLREHLRAACSESVPYELVIRIRRALHADESET